MWARENLQALLDLSSEEEDSDFEELVETTLLLSSLIKRKHRFWISDHIKQREKKGEFHLHSEFTDDEFRTYFRMSRDQFQLILELCKEDIQKKDTNYRKCIRAEERLAITLRFLSTGDSYRTIANSYRVGKCTVSRIVKDVCRVIWEKLQPVCMGEITTEKWRSVSEEFKNRWQFNNCIGAIDGKHVTIHAPQKSGSDYLNYKHTFSIVLLAVVDAQYRFLFVDIGSKGRFSDGGILSNSAFLSKIKNNTLNIPPDEPIENGGTPLPFVFIGDEAFPLQTYLMRPFPRGDGNEEKSIFNYRLSRARRVVENAFGILARRWRVYKRPFECKLESVVEVVKATCVLHNFLMTDSPLRRYDGEESSEPSTSDCQLIQFRRMGGNATANAFNVRNTFMQFFNSPSGAVSWQADRINRRLHERDY